MTSSDLNNRILQIKARFSPNANPEETPASFSDSLAASVLVPLALHNDELVLLFTHRSNTISRHRGQVSFPGGMQETSDPTFVDTALRETQEEIGIQPKQVEVFGRLPALVSISGYPIYPFVGYIHDLNGLHKNIDEVEKIFCIPLNWILGEGNLFQEDYHASDGTVHKVWTFKDYHGEKVWGLTAEITRRFIETIT